MIEITDKIAIGRDELVFRASRSSGPGGQNVNKLNTRITVWFDVANCPSLSAAQKRRILKSLATRADKQGKIHVASQRHRSQKANRDATVERLAELLRGALAKRPVRRKTAVPYAARQRRLEDKKRRSILKKQRAGKRLSPHQAESL